jgi:acyl carrier protein
MAAPSRITRIISDIWQETLDLSEIGLYDNFYDLGGYSLLLFTVQQRLQEVFGRELSITDLCSHPTVSDLARYFMAGSANGRSFETSFQRGVQQRQAVMQRSVGRA